MKNFERFEPFQAALVGLPVSTVWTGFMQALSIELGALTPQYQDDGTAGMRFGEMSVSFMPHWRFELAHRILCSSDRDQAERDRFFEGLLGLRIASVEIARPVAELILTFDNGYRLTGFCTDHDTPEWVITTRGTEEKSICVTGNGDRFTDEDG